MTHTPTQTPDAVISASTILNGRLAFDTILVTVRHPDGVEQMHFEQREPRQNLSPSQCSVLVCQPIVNRNRPIGRIVLHASCARLRATQLVRVARRLHNQITSTLGI